MLNEDQLDLLYEMCGELEEYANLEGTEMGELWSMLIALTHRTDYCMNENFDTILFDEIRAQLQNVKECTRIVESEETFTRKVKSLEWL